MGDMADKLKINVLVGQEFLLCVLACPLLMKIHLELRQPNRGAIPERS